MYVLMVYDVNVHRVGKTLKTARRYLRRVQNSVFEGELTPGRLASLKEELGAILDLEHDKVMFYTWRTRKGSSCEGIGKCSGYATGEALNLI